MSKYLTSEEAADYLRVTARTIGRYCQEGRIRFRKVGRSNLFTVEDLDAFVESGLVEEVA